MRHSSNFWTSSNLKDCDAPRRDWLSRGARQAFRFGVVCASTALGSMLSLVAGSSDDTRSAS